uniref:ZP domain-containing protein n=1 Tax=Sphaeramia orbicularis TaxID=375764 RepID=A0A673BPZ6_9TELE
IMRVDIGPLKGKILEVSGVINNSVILVTPRLASYCGFSMKIDPLGDAIVYASLQNCFALNVEDKVFKTVLNLRLYGNQMVEDELYQVAETCYYTDWAAREIICDRNYMEASERSRTFRGHVPKREGKMDQLLQNKGFKITKVVFFTPEERIMEVTEAQRAGYEIANTPTRLTLRSSKTAPETYIQQVKGVNMIVLKTSTVFEKKWQMTQIDAAAACPIQQGSISFTPYTIIWFLPKFIEPLISTNQPRLLEVFVGIDGHRLSPAEIAARGYAITVTDLHIIVHIPVGAVGGYFKDDQPFKTYTIEPMLELLWTEGTTLENTRYKVLFPITIPVPQIVDNTVAKERIFKVLLGPFGDDVALINITFPSGVLSAADCNVRGFNVQEHRSHNGSLKFLTLQVPFTDRLVLQMVFFILGMNIRTCFNSDLSPFISGSCDHANFYVLVKYGTHGAQFQTLLGKRTLSPDLAQQYNARENGTHFSVTVPFSAPDVVFEAVQGSSIRSRLDVTLRNPQTGRHVKDFALTCQFYSTLTECFPNGTITTVAVKVESVPSLNPGQLTLRDPNCGPRFSDDRFAYFVFTANSCGTKRKFLPNVMRYENEISLPNYLEKQDSQIICYYVVNTTYALTFHTRARRSQPYAEAAKGKLQIAMRLALDDTYSAFHQDEDYPLTKFLQEPLYFEVELMTLTNPHVSLELENCWATVDKDGTSQPRWNLIINGCVNPVDPHQVVFHSVWVDARVKYPSHHKRFEVRTFSFMKDQDTMSPQVLNIISICNSQCTIKNDISDCQHPSLPTHPTHRPKKNQSIKK